MKKEKNQPEPRPEYEALAKLWTKKEAKTPPPKGKSQR